MYNLTKVILISNLPESKWISFTNTDLVQYQNFLNLSVNTVLNSYRKVYLIMTNTYLYDPSICVPMEMLKDKYFLFNGNMSDLLVAFGNNTLPTIELPVIKTRYAKYEDAFRVGYKVEPVSLNVSITTPMLITDKESLRIHRPNPDTDMGVFYKNCLVTVNGHFHRTDYDGVYGYIIDGMKSSFKSLQNQIGIWSFLDVGNIEQIPITSDMIFAQTESNSLKDRTYVVIDKNSRGEPLDLTNKSVLLILGGYLIIPDKKAFFQTNSNTFAIDFNRMPFIERLYESNENIDLTSLNLPVSSDNPTLLNVDEVYSDDVLTAYLKLSQSFFVVVDSPELFVNRIQLRTSNLPGMYTSPFEPKYPLFINNGRVAEYWKVEEDLQWSVNVYQNYLVNRVFSYQPINSLSVIGDSRIPTKPYTLSQGMMLEVGRDF